MSNSHSRRTAIISLVILCLSHGILAIRGLGQDGVGGDAGSNMVTTFKGTLKGFQRGIVLVTREDGTEVMVQPPEDPAALVFVAQAKTAFLRQGSLVRFTGTFNQAGVAQSPIEKVELFQPVNGKLSGRAREQFTPGVYGQRRDGNEPAPMVAKVTVVGGVVGMDATGMMVQAGKIPVRAPLSAEAKFEIRFNNLVLAQEGDPVSVSGFYQSPNDTRVKAERVTITTDRVYGEPSEEKPRRRNRTRRTTNEDAGDPKPADSKPAGADDVDAAIGDAPASASPALESSR